MIVSVVRTPVVILYLGTGGSRAGVITDPVQGIALILGLAILLGVVIVHLGGVGHAVALASAPVAARPRVRESAWLAWEAWLVPIVGSITAQELASRVLACRTPTIA